MPLTPGSQLGVFTITGPIGVGGMGEVYQATDTNLKRQVAIKVLPASVAGDADRLARFQREAEVLAALNHPHIAAIYGLEKTPDGTALVMELVEGEDLSRRIARGAIPVDEALPLAKQIAEALEAAHEQGVVHRDLKPANIKVRRDGTVKVLDFGLAKAVDAPGGVSASTSGSLTTATMTQAGMILGTAAYMAPEQARGQTVDKRADIWAFGAVLFEMLTGQRAFPGEDLTDTLAAVVRAEPNWTLLPPGVSPALVTYVKRCLHKDPKQRIPDIAAMRLALDGAFDTAASSVGGPALPARATPVAWMAALAVAVLGLSALAFVHFREPPPVLPTEQAVMHTLLPMPDAARPNVNFLSLSPDGRRVLATVGSVLAVRNLDAAEWTPIAIGPTAVVTTPFWSHDGRAIGFFADGRLKTVSAAGGPVTDLCGETGGGQGGAWRSDGLILFGSEAGPMRTVSAAGGACAPVMQGVPQRSAGYPALLPDGVHYLYRGELAGTPASRGIYVASVDEPGAAPLSGKKILADNSSVLFTPPAHGGAPGHLLFLRGSNLMAQPFDARALTPLGEPFLVAPQGSTTTSLPQVAAGAGGGTLVYGSHLRVTSTALTWMDRRGQPLGTVGPVANTNGLSLSRDGLFATTAQRGDGLHLYDLTRNSEQRFITAEDRFLTASVWSQDGRDVVFMATLDGVRGIYRKPANGGGKAELLLPSPTNRQVPADLFSTGTLVFTELDPKTNGDIWSVSTLGAGARTPERVLATAAMESQPQLSPDGRWLAYVSDESGQREVYVRQFPSGPGFAKVSSHGGIEPRWKHDGSELYFREGGSGIFNTPLMAVPMHADSRGGISAGVPVALFLFTANSSGPQYNVWEYAPSPDGQRFLVSAVVETAAPAIHVITNWLKATQDAGKQ